jgi:hypothetical protein
MSRTSQVKAGLACVEQMCYTAGYEGRWLFFSQDNILPNEMFVDDVFVKDPLSFYQGYSPLGPPAMG